MLKNSGTNVSCSVTCRNSIHVSDKVLSPEVSHIASLLEQCLGERFSYCLLEVFRKKSKVLQQLGRKITLNDVNFMLGYPQEVRWYDYLNLYLGDIFSSEADVYRVNITIIRGLDTRHLKGVFTTFEICELLETSFIKGSDGFSIYLSSTTNEKFQTCRIVANPCLDVLTSNLSTN